MLAMEIRDGKLIDVAVPIPVPSPGEVLIQTRYVGVNRADLLQLQGKYPPPPGASPLPGLEVSGTIAATGDQVTRWNVGEEVCALVDGGGYAEYVTAPAGQVLPLPHGLSAAAGATLPEAAATSVMALMECGKLKRGERVLLHGGTSGVGLLMGQVARHWGAETFATAGGPEKCALLQKLQITAIDHQQAPFADQLLALTHHEGVDVIVDILGGPALGDHLRLLRHGGRLVSLAMLQGPMVESARIGGLLMKQLTLTGTTLRNRSREQKAALVKLAFQQLWPALRLRHIVPFIDRILPLTDAEKAFARMEERLHCGKILLEVAPK